MNDGRNDKKSRDDELERILAETAKNPYVPKRPVRASRPSAAARRQTVQPAKKAENNRSESVSERQYIPKPQSSEPVSGIDELSKRTADRIEEIKRARAKREAEMSDEHTAVFTRPERNQLPPQKPQERRLAEAAENDSLDIWDHDDSLDDYGAKPAALRITLNDVLDIVESMIAVILVILMFFTYILRFAEVDGASMEPTLEGNDRIIVRSIGYTPKNGDVVVIDNEKTHLLSENGKVVEGEGLEKLIVKRVIAVGGQTIDIDFENGSVMVDGKQLDEKYISEPTTRDEYAFEYPLTIPEGYVFVMGDNRNISKDSRHPEIGLVPEKNVVGKVIWRFYPFKEFGGVD